MRFGNTKGEILVKRAIFRVIFFLGGGGRFWKPPQPPIFGTVFPKKNGFIFFGAPLKWLGEKASLAQRKEITTRTKVSYCRITRSMERAQARLSVVVSFLFFAVEKSHHHHHQFYFSFYIYINSIINFQFFLQFHNFKFEFIIVNIYKRKASLKYFYWYTS